MICFIPLFIFPTFAQAQLATDNSFSFGFSVDEKCKGDVIDGWPFNKGILDNFDASIDLIGPHMIQVFVKCGENEPSCSNIELFAMPIDVEFESPWTSLPKI